MEKNKIHPLLKMALELGPIIIFFIGYGKIKDQVFVISGREYEGFIVATALFIPFDIDYHSNTLGIDWKIIKNAINDCFTRGRLWWSWYLV